MNHRSLALSALVTLVVPLSAAPLILYVCLVGSTDETCGNMNGSLDIGVSCGSPSFTISSYLRARTEDLDRPPASPYLLHRMPCTGSIIVERFVEQ